MSNTRGKVRARKMDPLHSVMTAIGLGQLSILKETLLSSASLHLFKKRLMAARVGKDQSPLVAAILKGDLDVFKYILNNFQVNLEQETSAIIEGGYPVEGATPLWTASTLGRMKFVQLLVEKGANIEHTTDSKSSPLRGAAFDGHCDVCEFLINKGADIDKPNQVGQSPLTIAAAMQKKECVQLLINKGADVNHKGHNGDTPLHVSVESGAVEIAKLLVTAGAQNNPNEVGFTPAILACCYGHKDVMNYLHQTFQLSEKELYDCYCLLAAKEVLGNNFQQAETFMRKSLEIRLRDPSGFSLPPAHPIYDKLQEPMSETDLLYILSDETRMFFLSSIYCERVLGQVHPTTAFYIRISGDMVLADDRYAKCIDLWHRSLEYDAAARMAYELQITEDLLFAVRGFSIMADNNFVPPVEPHFRWGLKEFRMAHESKISEISVISCLFRMIAVWIKVAECIKDEKEAAAEMAKVEQAVDDTIRAMEGKSCPVLIACLQNLPEHTSGAGKDIVSLDLPLHKATALFLEHGCRTDCEDEEGNFPLHLAVGLLDRSAHRCVQTLLEYGAHYDAVNFARETALDIVKSPAHKKPPEWGVLDELMKVSGNHISLQCLSARVIAECGVPYVGVLPQRIIDFVSWHEGEGSGGCIGGGTDHRGATPLSKKRTGLAGEAASVSVVTNGCTVGPNGVVAGGGGVGGASGGGANGFVHLPPPSNNFNSNRPST